MKPGNAGEGKDPDFWYAFEEGKVKVIGDEPANTDYDPGPYVQIEYRWAQNQYDRLSELAADLVRRQVAVILVNTSTMRTAKAATASQPVNHPPRPPPTSKSGTPPLPSPLVAPKAD